MSATSGTFEALCVSHGSDVIFRRADSVVPCPCRTPEGFRDMTWHLAHPSEPLCNERGMLDEVDSTLEISLKAFVQPVTSARGAKLPDEAINAIFGEVQADDHIGFFPEQWNGTVINFRNWGRSGEDYIVYDGRRFIVVNANLIPDPVDGNPRHHWEAGLRLITDAPITA